MTDREPGTPDDASPADETQSDPFDPADEEPALGYFDAEGPDDEASDVPADDEVEDEVEDDDEDDEREEGAEEDRAVAAPTGRGSRITSGGQPRPGTAAAGPGVAERAVHLDDRASALFVLAIVATFVGIFLYGMLAGSSGFFTPLPTEAPFVEETEPPSESPSLEPSASPSVSVSPSAAASRSPGASPSGSAGASPSASAGASASAPTSSASAPTAPASVSPSP